MKFRRKKKIILFPRPAQRIGKLLVFLLSLRAVSELGGFHKRVHDMV